MVDRGADLAWVSQYGHEREILFPPLTGLEVVGSDVEGESLIVSVRLSLNLKALTLDQVPSHIYVHGLYNVWTSARCPFIYPPGQISRLLYLYMGCVLYLDEAPILRVAAPDQPFLLPRISFFVVKGQLFRCYGSAFYSSQLISLLFVATDQPFFRRN